MKPDQPVQKRISRLLRMYNRDLPGFVLALLMTACGGGGDKAGLDLEGKYCSTLSNETSTLAAPVTVNHQGDQVTVTFDLSDQTGSTEGFVFRGLTNNETFRATTRDPSGEEVNLELVFDTNGGFTGTMDSTSRQLEIVASPGSCHDYVNPAGDPQCILPYVERSTVIGGQQYNSVYQDRRHSGLDFQFPDGVQAIHAPCAGVVVAFHRNVTENGDTVFEVQLLFNERWRYFIGFEPNSTDPYINAAQAELLAVELNQIVRSGDFLGYLLIPNTVYPVIHWQIDEIVTEGERQDVIPCKYLSTVEQDRLTADFDNIGLSPACYDIPVEVNP